MHDLLLEWLPSRGIQYTWYTKQAEATITHLQVTETAAKIDTAQLFLALNAEEGTAKCA